MAGRFFDQLLEPEDHNEDRPVHSPALLSKTADSMYHRLRDIVGIAEADLREEEDLHMYVSAPGVGDVLVNGIGYFTPHLVIFSGTDAKNRDCDVAVHMTAVQVAVVRVPKSSDAQRRKIVFLASLDKRVGADPHQAG